MAEAAFKNFGDLYRAAFAEPNTERKTLLLSQVQKALEDWERTSANRLPAVPLTDVPPPPSPYN
jgi:hypothetical protein